MKTIFSAAVAAAILGATLATPAQAQLSPYSQNFEGLDINDGAALTNDGWNIFGNVYDSGGVFLFGYGVFGAPNGGSGFSAIDTGQGGAAQGLQQLSIYNDYNCCQPSNGHFGAGTDLVESIVFQEQTISAADVGETYEFFFEAKKGNIEGATTANGFIKTLDPNAGFATTNFIDADTTLTPDTWTPYTLSITIDAGLVGQLLQIGFSSTASAFQGSGVFYDNLNFAPAGTDSDGDGVDDSTDNCTDVANPGQEDFNGDSIGDICDADVTGPGAADDDCFVNFLDLQKVKDAFFSNPASPTWDEEVDFDNSNLINFADLQIVKDSLFGPPGPSAAGCN